MQVQFIHGYARVTVSPDEVAAFKRVWPGSTLPADTEIVFSFEPNGDLVAIDPDSSEWDGADLVALSQDAGAYANQYGVRK